MNEILGMVFWVLKDEHEAFRIFSLIMGEWRDLFQKQLDKTVIGIKYQMDKFQEMLQIVDPEMSEHMLGHSIKAEMFVLRWLMLGFLQEFELLEGARLWDSILAFSENKMVFVRCIGVAMLVLKRQQILEGDFVDIMRCVQKLGDNVEKIVAVGMNIYNQCLNQQKAKKN